MLKAMASSSPSPFFLLCSLFLHSSTSDSSAVNPIANSGASSSKCRGGTSSGSWWFCGEAARNCHSMLLLVPVLLFLLLFCVPYSAMGHEMVSYDIFNSQERVHSSLDVNGDVSASGKGLKLLVTILEGMRWPKEQKEAQFSGMDDPFELPKLAIEVTSYQQDGYEFGLSPEGWESQSFMEVKDDGEEGYAVFDRLWPSSSKNLPKESTFACFSTRVSSLMRHAFLEAVPLHGKPEKNHQSFQGSSSSVPNVAIIPPHLEWKSQSLFSPSVGYLTVLNTCNNSILHVFRPFTTNSQFFVFGLKESTIPPGGMLSIPVIFLPTILGMVEGLLVVQTSAGGLLVQIRGEGITSPYRLQSLAGLSASSGMKLQHSVFLHNPYDEPLLVEEVYLWFSDTDKQSMSPFTADTDSGKGVMCKKNVIIPEVPMGSGSWVQFLSDGSHSSNLNGISVELRPAGDWTIGPHLNHPIVDLGVTINNEDSLVGTLCIRITHHLKKLSETVVLPLKVESMRGASSNRNVYVVPEVLDFGVLSENQKRQQSIVLVNQGSEFLMVERIFTSSADINIISIDYNHGMVLEPRTENQVASITYAGITQKTCWLYNRCATLDCCHLTIQTNGTDIKVPYQAVVLFGPSDCLFLDSSSTASGNVEDACLKPRHHLQLQNGCKVPLSIIRELEKKIWTDGQLPDIRPNSDATSSRQSVLETPELLFPLVQLGMEEVQWVTVFNPSDKPVKMDLMVSSEAGASQCKQEDGESDVNHILNHINFTADLRVGSNTIGGQEGTGTQSGIFLLAESGVSDTLVQPKSKAMLGPIVFRPMQRCVWTSLIAIRNNLTRIEWLPVQGSGGSSGLTFLHEEAALKVLLLEFNLTPLVAPQAVMIKQQIHELISHAAAKASCRQRVTREFQVKNTGDMPLEVESVMLAGGVCDSHGFMLDSCNGFYLSPGQTTQLIISYQPDFSGIFSRELQVSTSFGMLIIPLRANLAPELLPFCQKPSFFLKFEKLLLHICLIALLSVLIIFIKMLKQERLSSTIDTGDWPSGSPTKLFAPVELKISRKGKEKDSGRQRQKITDPVSPTKNSVYVASHSSRAYKYLGDFSNFLAPIKSAFRFWDIIFCNIKLKKLKVETPGADLVQLSADTVKPDSGCMSNVSSNAAERKGNLTQVGNNISKVHSQSATQMNVIQGGSKSNGINVAANDLTVADSSQQQLQPASVPLPPTAPRSSSSLQQTELDLQQVSTTHSQLTCQKGSQMLPKPESQLQQISTTESQLTCQKGSQTSSKTGVLEEKKEKGKKKKKKSSVSVSKQEVENGNRSGSSSPVSSPTSPATPVSLSRPVSPFSPLETLTTATTVLVNENGVSLHKKNQDLEFNVSTQQNNSTDDLTLKIMDAAYKLLQKQVGPVTNTTDSVQRINNAKGKARGMPVKECASVPRKTVADPKAVHAHDSEKPLSSWDLDKAATTRPVLKSSATFPGGIRCSRWNQSSQGENRQPANVSASGVSHGASSVLTPIGRAPGTRLVKQNIENAGNDVGLQKDSGSVYAGWIASYSAEQNNKENIQADNFVYDIWGDHFAEISRGPRYSEGTFLGQTCLVEDSQSLFAKSAFMDSTSSLVVPVVSCSPASPPDSSLSVCSTTDCLFTSHRLSPLLSDWIPE